MAELPNGLKMKDLERFVFVNNKLKDYKPEREKLAKTIKMAFAGVLKLGKPALYGKVIVTLGEQKRFDCEAFEKAYPYEKYPQYYVHTLDATLVPEILKRDRFYEHVPVLKADLVQVETATVDEVPEAAINVESGAEAAA